MKEEMKFFEIEVYSLFRFSLFSESFDKNISLFLASHSLLFSPSFTPFLTYRSLVR